MLAKNQESLLNTDTLYHNVHLDEVSVVVCNLATCQRGSAKCHKLWVSEASGLRYMPSGTHSQPFYIIMCLHTPVVLAIITSSSVITHPGLDITCSPPMSSHLFCYHTLHSEDPRFETKYALISALVVRKISRGRFST